MQLKLKNNQKGKPGFTPISFLKRGTEWRVQENSPAACEPTLFKSQNTKFYKIFKRIYYSRTLIYPSSFVCANKYNLSPEKASLLEVTFNTALALPGILS